MERETPKCEKCGSPMVKDLAIPIRNRFMEKVGEYWDGHTYKADCSCVDKSWRLSIG